MVPHLRLPVARWRHAPPPPGCNNTDTPDQRIAGEPDTPRKAPGARSAHRDHTVRHSLAPRSILTPASVSPLACALMPLAAHVGDPGLRYAAHTFPQPGAQ